jgi:hypothetical protein
MSFEIISNIIFKIEKGIKEYREAFLIGSVELSEDEYLNLKKITIDLIDNKNNKYRR